MQPPLTAKRRLQIFATGITPLLVLAIILAMASKFGLDIVSLFAQVEKRDAANYVVETKVLGVVISSRPATAADLAEEDAIMRVVKVVVLVGSFAVITGSLVMCYTAIMQRPRSMLVWFDQKL
jgi:hypothetical protein